MPGRTLVALYDEPAAAWEAAGGLDAANVPAERIHVIGGAEGTSALGEGFNAQTGSGAVAESRGFGVPGTGAEALMAVGVPEEDARFYAEAVRQGGTLLLVRLDEEHEARATNLVHARRSPDDGPSPASADMRADARFVRVNVYGPDRRPERPDA